MSQPLVEARRLSKAYPASGGHLFGRRRKPLMAVRDVSLDIWPGETLGLAGESGSGKSTLGRALLRLIEPTNGLIRFDGEDVTRSSGARLRNLRRNAQIIFQDPYSSLDPMMTVGDCIVEPLAVQGLLGGPNERRKRMFELLDSVSLPHNFSGRRPRDLSGGQRQRVVIARALSVDPKFVVADEPVSSLDVSIQGQILALLRERRLKSNLSMLFVSHDIAAMEYISNRIAVMYLGTLVEIGPAAEVVANPKHPYTEALISAVPGRRGSSGGRRIVLEGDPPNPLDPPSGCVFHTRCRYRAPECTMIVPSLREAGPSHSKACLRDDVL